MTTYAHTERRTAPRVSFDGWASISLNPASQIPCKGINISTTGILVESFANLPSGAEVDIALTLPDRAEPLQVQGILARQDLLTTAGSPHGSYRCGIRFGEISDRTRATIDGLIGRRGRAKRIRPGANLRRTHTMRQLTRAMGSYRPKALQPQPLHAKDDFELPVNAAARPLAPLVEKIPLRPRAQNKEQYPAECATDDIRTPIEFKDPVELQRLFEDAVDEATGRARAAKPKKPRR